jgi:flagellar basal body-associated protein FliL
MLRSGHKLVQNWLRRRGSGRQKAVVLARFTALLIVTFGCGSAPTFEFDEMDLVAAEEKFTEFPLGQFKVPIPAPENRLERRVATLNRVQVDFQLFALVEPIHKSHIEESWKRHEGMIRDRVIRVCRSATLEELHEPELETLKARLMDAIGPQLGDELQQLLITEVVSQEI